MEYKETPGGKVVDCQLMMSSGEEYRTLNIVNLETNRTVLRLHLTHEQFGRMTVNQLITAPAQLFSEES